VDEISALHRKVYTITHRKAFTIEMVLYKIEQFGYIILKMKVKNFDKSQCSDTYTVFCSRNTQLLFIIVEVKVCIDVLYFFICYVQ